MTGQTIVRAAIISFGLLALGVVALIVFVGDHDPTESLYAAEGEFVSDPSESKLRKFLNTESDGADSYLQMAMVGRTFTSHSEMYQSIARGPTSDLERHWLRKLANVGEGLFEYGPASRAARPDGSAKSTPRSRRGSFMDLKSCGVGPPSDGVC